MLKKKLLLAALAATTIGFAVPASSADIYIDLAPPTVRYEVVPAARHGYVWQTGYWDYSAGRHAWRKGYWVKERKGYYWHPNRWQQDNGRWHLVKGNWGRERYMADRDHDGIPNRLDRDKDGDGIRNSRDRDRDGDGVPNKYDRRPDNANRR